MLDKATWKDLLKKARKGDADAQSTVADYFQFGFETDANEIIVRKNFKSAYSWYEKAAQNGITDALTNLADFLSQGKGCEKNTPKAIQAYLSAIDKGSSRAAFNLGTVFRDKGKFDEAFKYYLLSNELDDADYSLTVGLCYYHGVGVSVDREKACEQFIKVSDDKLRRQSQYEIDEANYLLGISFLNGDGVVKSFKKAQKFLSLANIDGDHRSAKQILFITMKSKI